MRSRTPTQWTLTWKGLTKKAYEYIEPVRLEIFGNPSPSVLEMMQQAVGSGVDLVIKPQSLFGYLRLESS